MTATFQLMICRCCWTGWSRRAVQPTPSVGGWLGAGPAAAGGTRL